MLVMNIEIWPRGAEELKYKIGEITAANLTARGSVCTYQVRMKQDAYEAAGVIEIYEEIVLRNHPRSAGPLALVRDALTMILPAAEADTRHGHRPRVSETRPPKKYAMKIPPRRRKTARSSLRSIVRRMGLRLTVLRSENVASRRTDLIEPTDGD